LEFQQESESKILKCFGVGVYSAGAESESKISYSVHLWYLELIEVGYCIIISIMVSFMRLSQKLVFHQSKCISAIKRILSTSDGVSRLGLGLETRLETRFLQSRSRSRSSNLWYFELIEVGYYIIISLMASFMRLSQKLVFHQSKCISAIKHILSTTAVCMYLRLPSYIWVFHVTASAMHVWSLVRCVWEWRRCTTR